MSLSPDDVVAFVSYRIVIVSRARAPDSASSFDGADDAKDAYYEIERLSHPRVTISSLHERADELSEAINNGSVKCTRASLLANT